MTAPSLPPPSALPMTCGSWACGATALLMTALQLGQLLPQHITMATHRSSDGVSPWLLFFNSLYTFLAMVDLELLHPSPPLVCTRMHTAARNTPPGLPADHAAHGAPPLAARWMRRAGAGLPAWGRALQSSSGQPSRRAGSAVDTGRAGWMCIAAWQPHVQMAGCALLSITLWVWFLTFDRHDVHPPPLPAARSTAAPPEVSAAPPTTALAAAPPVSARRDSAGVLDLFVRLLSATLAPHLRPQTVFHILLAAMALVALAAVLLLWTLGPASAAVRVLAYLCGIASALTNTLMWLPQLALTAATHRRGALSITWVAASLVMDVAYSIYLASLGVHWTVWLNNVPDGLLTAALLAMLLRFEWRERHERRERYHRGGVGRCRVRTGTRATGMEDSKTSSAATVKAVNGVKNGLLAPEGYGDVEFAIEGMGQVIGEEEEEATALMSSRGLWRDRTTTAYTKCERYDFEPP